MSRPYLAALRPSGTHKPRTRQQAHTRGVSTQASKPGQRGGRSHTVPPPQASAHKQARKHPHEHAPRANTKPQPPASKHAHNKPQQGTPPSEHKERPRQSAWASKTCERRRTRVPNRGDRHEAKQAKPPQGRARRTSTQGARKQPWFAPKRCRPAPARRGVRRERKAAHNSPRQSAWVVVFVGVFADVCRRFWAGWFGGLGVFWGCLACFLVF